VKAGNAGNATAGGQANETRRRLRARCGLVKAGFFSAGGTSGRTAASGTGGERTGRVGGRLRGDSSPTPGTVHHKQAKAAASFRPFKTTQTLPTKGFPEETTRLEGNDAP